MFTTRQPANQNMVSTKLSTFDTPSIKASQRTDRSARQHLSFTVLSNSSFDYLNMFPPPIPVRSSSQTRQLSAPVARSRTTTEGSAGPDLTSFEILEAKAMHISDVQRLRRAPSYTSNIQQRSPDAGERSRRVPEPSCPTVPSRKAGASLPRSPAMQDLDVLAQATSEGSLGLEHLAGTLSIKCLYASLTKPGNPVFGSSNQRSRRLAIRTADSIATEKARDDHLAMTMESLTFSPSTVESTSLATPQFAHGELPRGNFPKPAAMYGTHTGLGLGFIGNQTIRPPAETVGDAQSSPSTAPPEDWRFTLSTHAASPGPSSRKASTHLDVESLGRLEGQLTGSSKAGSRLPSAGAQSSLVDSYYYGSQSGRTGQSDRGQSRPATRGPSRSGIHQEVRRNSMDMLSGAYPFAFCPPIPKDSAASVRTAASSPKIDFTKSPSIGFTRPPPNDVMNSPMDSFVRRSPPATPHKIKRKPVPSVEEWTLAVNESTKCNSDVPTERDTVSHSRPSPRVYIHDRYAKSTPNFTLRPIAPPAESAPPLVVSKSTSAVQTLKESFKSFSVNYRSKSFGKKTAGDISSTSISTGESTDLQTPRDSYEDFADIPVRRQERYMVVAPVHNIESTNGYTTHGQREAVRLAEASAGEKKKKGRFAKLFAIQ